MLKELSPETETAELNRLEKRRADRRSVERRGIVTEAVVPFVVEERRQGLICRRKEVRAGGRRRSDAGALLATGSSSAR